jgi:hypothetical protein
MNKTIKLVFQAPTNAAEAGLLHQAQGLLAAMDHVKKPGHKIDVHHPFGMTGMVIKSFNVDESGVLTVELEEGAVA